MTNNTNSPLNNTSRAARELEERLINMVKDIGQIQNNLENSLRQTKNDDVKWKAILRFVDRREKIFDEVIKSVQPKSKSSLVKTFFSKIRL